MSNVANFVEQMKKYKDTNVKPENNKVVQSPKVIVRVNTQMMNIKGSNFIV